MKHTLRKDCSKCNQTAENCECHIPDEEKHSGLKEFCEKFFNPKSK